MTRRREAKKTSTLITDRGRIERHIKPLLGALSVATVTRDDVELFMHDVATGKTATRTKTGKKRGLANVRGGRVPQAGPSGCWARFSLTQCGTECGSTIQCGVLRDLRTASASGA